MRTTIVFLIAMLLSACQTVVREVPVPTQFAYYKGHSPEILFRAVSPDNVVYRIKAVATKEKTDLDFWKTALETYYKKSGYLIIRQNPIKASKVPGESFVLANTYAGRDYTYMLNVFVVDGKVMLIEAAGENKVFEKYQQILQQTVAATDLSKLDCTSCEIKALILENQE